MNQLTLDLNLADKFDFSSFCVGSNAWGVEILKNMAACQGERLVFVWGVRGVGRTHILNAVCHEASLHQHLSVYFSLSDFVTQSHPGVLSEIAHIPIICIDDLQCVAGHSQWEEALFSLYNDVRDRGGRLVMSADAPPHRLPILLQDLLSRLQAMLVFELRALTDLEKVQALKAYANHKSFELSDEVVQFILTRGQRDMRALVNMLKKLEHESLVNHRKITIPFVKEILYW